jgi:hypothetical protein
MSVSLSGPVAAQPQLVEEIVGYREREKGTEVNERNRGVRA